jgi:hypothetical protein
MATFGARRAKAAFSQWVRDPPGYRSSRKQMNLQTVCPLHQMQEWLNN